MARTNPDYCYSVIKRARKMVEKGVNTEYAAATIGKAITARMREPWREYTDIEPYKMPARKGSPATLAKLVAIYGETVTD